MAGIAGIACGGRTSDVHKMLGRLSHRGDAGSKIIENGEVTFGAVWPEVQKAPVPPTLSGQAVWDTAFPPLPDEKAFIKETLPFAIAATTPDGVILARDPLGVRPLYFGYTDDGALCFASEVKALQEITSDIQEFPPGALYEAKNGISTYAALDPVEPVEQSRERVAAELRLRLEQAVIRRLDETEAGSWLSGGLDSSAIVALVRPQVDVLHTFAGGFPGAPDLIYAREVADYIQSDHHEVLVEKEDLLDALPEVIYHLESFDALLVRSTIVNYLVAQEAKKWVGSVFSGEGADELFAGYSYLEDFTEEQLSSELIEITRSLHNTALQRVDRSSTAHGLVAYVPFLDSDVVDYVMKIPPAYKRGGENEQLEKWILRTAIQDILPEDVVWRKKAKFWEGAGVGDILSQHADEQISDADFQQERQLDNGWQLNTKEELLYYRLFEEQFGDLASLSWMGRTKRSPQQKLVE